MTSAIADRSACDTSVLVPALVAWHPQHAACLQALTDVEHVPAHVLVECFSVLTRLPAPHRLSASDTSALVGALPLSPIGLPAEEVPDLVISFGRRGIRGGAAYDALVGATAAHHGCLLVTRDKRASATYDLVGATYHLVSAATE